MCISDWRAGRLIRTVLREASVAAAPVTIAPDNNRVGLWIGWPTGGTSLNSMSVTAGGVLVCCLDSSFPVYYVTFDRHGDLPTKAHIVTNISNGTTVGIVEMIMPEEYLAAGLEQFRSAYSRYTR